MRPIAEIISTEVILPHDHIDPVLAMVIKFELPASGKPHDVILDASEFMRSKKADYYQAELVYRHFRTNEYHSVLTDIHPDEYSVEIELLSNNFREMCADSLYFYVFVLQ